MSAQRESLRAPPLLLDTNIISALMREPYGRVGQKLHGQQDLGRRVCTSIVVQCELLFGLARVNAPRLVQAHMLAMRRIEVLPLDADVAAHYAALRTYLERAGTPIGPNDALIAAHALAVGAVMITDNDAEFTRVPELAVENWLRPT